MSLNISLPWLTLFAILSLTTGLVGVIFSIILRFKQLAFNHTLSAYNKEILTNSTVGIGRCLIDMENELQKLAHSQYNIQLNDPMRSTYQHATALLQKGASIDEVIQTCDVSRVEAEFLHKLAIRYS